MLNALEQAPNFCLLGDDGETHTLESFQGRPVVLFFYPKDSTPGCTQEAKDFSALLDEFEHFNAKIIGISKDSIASHASFKCKYSLSILLLSDPDLIIHKKYFALKENSIFGKTALAINRCTFLIDEKGKIIKSWYKVRVKNHAQIVLDALIKAKKVK